MMTNSDTTVSSSRGTRCHSHCQSGLSLRYHTSPTKCPVTCWLQKLLNAICLQFYHMSHIVSLRGKPDLSLKVLVLPVCHGCATVVCRGSTGAASQPAQLTDLAPLARPHHPLLLLLFLLLLSLLLLLLLTLSPMLCLSPPLLRFSSHCALP